MMKRVTPAPIPMSITTTLTDRPTDKPAIDRNLIEINEVNGAPKRAHKSMHVQAKNRYVERHLSF